MIRASWCKKHGDDNDDCLVVQKARRDDDDGDDGYDYASATCIEGVGHDMDYGYAPAASMGWKVIDDIDDDGGYDYAPAA
ncbi:unnamed protein product [Malus baccata var. baccata]